MIYQNDKLRIVPFERGKHMTKEYRSWFNDPEVTKYNSHGLFPYSPGAMDAFVKTIEQGSDSKIVWAIEVSNKEEHEAWKNAVQIAIPEPPQWIHIGNCSLDRINWINRSAELTIVLGKERGKGFGMQACEWMLEHAFLKLNLHRVWTGTAARNIGMRRVCEKLGMRHEGNFIDGMFLDGAYVNVIAYGILNDMQNTIIEEAK